MIATLRRMIPTPTEEIPLLSRAMFAREVATWSLVPIMMGAAEGGVVGVLAKNAFADAVPSAPLNLAVAVLSGLPALANLSSFLWTSLSHGRDKVRFLVGLQIATVVLVAMIAAVPISGLGLALLVLAVGGARACWSGVVTLRSTVWRVNYPRQIRASVAGRFAAVQAVLMTLTVVLLGAVLDLSPAAFRFFYPAVALAGMAGAWSYRRLRVRGHRALLREERLAGRERAGAWALRGILRDDEPFRRYMTCMWIFGIGNIMVTAPLIVILKDRLDVSPLRALLIITAVPTLVMPLAIPAWSRLLDRAHIVRFRAIHAWAFVASTAMMLVGSVLAFELALWIGAVCKGIAFGGGVLGWNLGHHDFAPRQHASSYMGVHVTLTGLRGLVAPLLGISIYEILERTAGPGMGAWTFAVCLGLNLVGAAGFIVMAREMGPVSGRLQPHVASNR